MCSRILILPIQRNCFGKFPLKKPARVSDRHESSKRSSRKDGATIVELMRSTRRYVRANATALAPTYLRNPADAGCLLARRELAGLCPVGERVRRFIAQLLREIIHVQKPDAADTGAARVGLSD